jgi:hypothetical protein
MAAAAAVRFMWHPAAVQAMAGLAVAVRAQMGSTQLPVTELLTSAEAEAACVRQQPGKRLGRVALVLLSSQSQRQILAVKAEQFKRQAVSIPF